MIYNLRSYHGGLGDELQFSTLPEMLTKAGHEVYLYGGDKVLPYRNEEIKEFVWGNNPYIKGVSYSGEWNAGDTPVMRYINDTDSFIKNWEKGHGLEPENDLPNVYREAPTKRTACSEFLFELSSHTLKYNEKLVMNSVRCIFDKHDKEFLFHAEQMVSPKQSNRIPISFLPVHKTKSLIDIFNKLCFCKVFVSLNSGTHSVAAAVRRVNKYMKHYCILPEKDYEWIMQQKKFVFPGIIYIKEGDEI